MHLSSGTARRVVAAAIALQAGLATTLLGAGGAGADAAAGCERITGHLIDHGTTVTAVFHVPVTCKEVSVLSWLAPDAHAGMPQTLFDRKSADDVAPGDYRWTIAAPPPECFRQLDLRIPGHNVDAIVGGERKCPPSSLTPPTSSPTTTIPHPTTTSPRPAPKPAADAECTHWNVTAKSHEVVDGRYVQHFTLDATCRVKLVSFAATGPNWPHNGPQVPFDRWIGTRGPGAHTESVDLPPCFFQADLVVNHRVIDTETGGNQPCAPPAPPVTPLPTVTPPPPPTTTTTEATTPTTTPPTTAPPTTAPPTSVAPSAVTPPTLPAPIAPSAVAPLRIVGPTGPPTTSTTTPAAVLGVVLTPPSGAAAPLPKTGSQQSGLASVALTGIAIGFGLLTVGRRRRRSLQAHPARR